MTETYPCPVCGRAENRRGDPFTDPSQTAAHIEGAHDSDHKHVSSSDVEITAKANPDSGGGMNGTEVTPTPNAGASKPGLEPTDTDGQDTQASGSQTDPTPPATLPTPDSGDENGGSGSASGIAIAVGLLVLLAAVLGGTDDDRRATIGPGRSP